MLFKSFSGSLTSKIIHGSLCIRHSGLCAFWKSCGFLGSIGKLPSGRRASYVADRDPGTVLVLSLGADSMSCSSLNLWSILHRAWHLLVVPVTGCELERRGWAERIAARVEQGCITIGLVCVETQCGRVGASGEWLLSLSLMGPSARNRTEEQCLSAQPNGEAPEVCRAL